MTTPITTAKKTLIVSVPGAEHPKEIPIDIVPGTKPRDVLQRLSLTGFGLSRPGGGGLIGVNDDLFPLVEDGQKLFATPTNVEAGADTGSVKPGAERESFRCKRAQELTTDHQLDVNGTPLIFLDLEVVSAARRAVLGKTGAKFSAHR